jgi:hypothetical protein
MTTSLNEPYFGKNGQTALMSNQLSLMVEDQGRFS